MGQYDTKIALAKRLIDKFGEPLTLRNFPPAGDTAKPWRPSTPDPGVLDFPNVMCALLNLDAGKPPIQYGDGSESKLGDKYGLIAALGPAQPPELGSMLLRSNGEVWTIKKLGPLDVGGAVILYELWAVR